MKRYKSNLCSGVMIILMVFVYACNDSKRENEVIRIATTDAGEKIQLLADGRYIFVKTENGDRKLSDDYNIREDTPGRSVRGFVEDVIDGDTYVIAFKDIEPGLNEKETVRLIGVDAPELKYNEYYALEAKQQGERLVKGKDVSVAFGEKSRDVFCRLLAYVYFGENELLNSILIEKGCCRIYSDKLHPLTDTFINIQDVAIESGVGCWANKAGTVHIAYIYNYGHTEYLILANATDHEINISDWQVVDKSGLKLNIPKHTLMSKNSIVKLYSGNEGIHNPPICYYLSRDNIWNNDGDEAILMDAEGVFVDSYVY